MSGHWSEPYLGRPWIAGEYECDRLVADVLADVFALDWRPPAHATTWQSRHATLTAGLETEVARMLARGEQPCDGDGVLMSQPARARCTLLHIGVAAVRPDGLWVLHCARRSGAVFHPVRDLPRRGFALEGVYRWTLTARDVGRRDIGRDIGRDMGRDVVR